MLVRFALTLDVHRGIIQSLSLEFHRADLCLPASRSCQYKRSGLAKLISGRGPYGSKFLGTIEDLRLQKYYNGASADS
jgi:hypothetical protein